jgi:hypothetical protein
LVHEVGHQGAALLELVESLRPLLRGMQTSGGEQRLAWQLWDRWISEILSDLWSVARVGIAATTGLMGVVSLPRPFVFRMSMDDPHPMPWIRVKLSSAMGHALYAHPQWQHLASLWESYYPIGNLDQERRAVIALLEQSMPAFVTLLVNHRPRSLRGRSLGEALAAPERQPGNLAAAFQLWRAQPERMRQAAPSLVFAAIGQARVDGKISPEEESRLLAYLLTYWALRSTLDTSALCIRPPAIGSTPARIAIAR